MAAPGTAQWSSRFAFIMAAVGSSVGLGNLWRFSAEAGSNGGGAFILIYILCVLFIGIPVLMSEYILGRAGQASSAVKSLDDLSDRSQVSRFWSSGAWLGMIASFLIVSFYCVVAAWVLAYIPKFLFGEFNGLSPEQIANLFVGTENITTGEIGCSIEDSNCKKVGIINDPFGVLPYFLFFGALTAFLISRGVNKGIEIAAKYLMPLFFVLLISLALYSVVSTIEDGGAAEAFAFMFKPDFTKINGDVAVSALGQACFSIGIGNAIMITYGSYLPRNVSIPKSSLLVGLTDTGVALIAGLAIFPIVFAHNLDFSAGAGLFFQTLPTALTDLPAGNLIGAAFFFLAFFAAITSSISLLEPSAAWFAEQFKVTKKVAAWTTGAAILTLGLGSVYIAGFMDFIDTGLVGPIIAPLSALMVILFTGWRLNKKILDEELAGDGEALGRFLMILVKYVAPVFVTIVLIAGIYSKYLAG